MIYHLVIWLLFSLWFLSSLSHLFHFPCSDLKRFHCTLRQEWCPLPHRYVIIIAYKMIRLDSTSIICPIHVHDYHYSFFTACVTFIYMRYSCSHRCCMKLISSYMLSYFPLLNLSTIQMYYLSNSDLMDVTWYDMATINNQALLVARSRTRIPISQALSPPQWVQYTR